MQEFYQMFLELARKHFPDSEFKEWNELTDEDKIGLAKAYTTIIAAQDALSYADRIERALTQEPTTEEEWEYRWSLGLEE